MPNDLQFSTGAADRPTDYQKPKAWLHKEISAAFVPAVWKEKKPAEFITYPKRNQLNQSSCTCYTLAKQLAIDELTENGVWRELSPRSVYPYVFEPGGGANSLNATKTAHKLGMTLEALLKTDTLTEDEVRKDTGYVTDAKQVALVYKPGSYIECNADFETVASILQTFQNQGIKKAVAITLIGCNNGTWSSAYPKPPASPADTLWYHRVPVVDFGMINGKQYLAIDNSWGEAVGLKGQQFLSKDYEQFIYGGIYTINQPDNWQQLTSSQVTPPHWVWNTNLDIGSFGKDVEMLQIALQSLGMFPVSSIIKPTGTFGGLTKAAVMLFQAAFGIETVGNVGPKTRAKLNEIFK